MAMQEKQKEEVIMFKRAFYLSDQNKPFWYLNNGTLNVQVL